MSLDRISFAHDGTGWQRTLHYSDGATRTLSCREDEVPKVLVARRGRSESATLTNKAHAWEAA